MMIDGLAIARAIHVLALVHWIGGVAIVTTIVLPHAKRRSDAKAALAEFEAFERRFAAQARISILFAGLSGLYLLYQLDAWSRFLEASFWWLHLMVAVWTIFALMIYVLEPLAIHKFFAAFVLRDKERAFARAIRMHTAILTISALAIAAGVLGAHGALP